MCKNVQEELLYDPMPRPDAKIPPISHPGTVQDDAKRLQDDTQQEVPKDLLSNLSFR